MGNLALKGLSTLFKTATQAAPEIAKQAKKVISNGPTGALAMLQTAPKLGTKDANATTTGTSSLRLPKPPSLTRDAGAGAPPMQSSSKLLSALDLAGGSSGMSSTRNSPILSQLTQPDTGASSTRDSILSKLKPSGAEPSTTRNLAQSAVDMATGGLNPQHLVVAGSEAATQISQALHPTDPQASMTPITPLTSQQQHQMDAMELQGNQSMAMQMKVAAMKQQMDMTSSLVDVAEKGTANIGKAASGGS